MIEIVVMLIIVGVALYLIQLIPMDATIKKVIVVLVILIVVLWVLSALGLFQGGFALHPLRR